MKSNELITIVNISESELVSDILTDLIYFLKNQDDDTLMEYKAKKSSGTKAIGEVIIQIAVGVTISVLSEILKIIINKYKNRDDFSSQIKINIVNKELSLNDISNGSLEIGIKTDKLNKHFKD